MQRALNTRLTYDDYAAIPSDGKTYQIVDGEVYVTPAPSPFHQRSSKRLQRQLEAYFELSGAGEVFDAPIDRRVVRAVGERRRNGIPRDPRLARADNGSWRHLGLAG